MTADDTARREANLAAVRTAFEAVGRQDADAQVLGYADDAVVEFPFGDPPGRYDGREAIRQMLAGAFTTFHMQLTIDRVHHCANADEMVVELHSDGTLAGQRYHNDYVIFFQFRDGEVVHQREYFNPMAMAKILGQG